MASWLASGHLVEVILALTVLEGLVLVLFHRVTGRGIAPRDFGLNLLSGMALLAALREALVGDWWGWIAAFLLAALMAHLGDLALRWIR